MEANDVLKLCGADRRFNGRPEGLRSDQRSPGSVSGVCLQATFFAVLCRRANPWRVGDSVTLAVRNQKRV